MLTQINISNLVTIQSLQLDLLKGTTVITGETGAGKSILIDAIELALGGRVNGSIIRPGKDKADVSISFDISNLPAAIEWLKNYDLDAGNNECLIRRTITLDGRSRSYINGMPSTLQPLRELCDLLIHIHGQHEHQTLLKPDKQRDILDRFAGHFDLIDQVQLLAEQWAAVNKDILELRTRTQERAARSEYLKFQLAELEELQLQPNEFVALETEHKQLAHADELLQHIQHALHCLTDNEEVNSLHLLNQSLTALESVQRIDPKIALWVESIKNANLILSDVEDDLRRYLDNVELDPQKLQQIEQRIGAIFDLARKHKVAPQDLFELQQKISAEYSTLENSDEHLAKLSQQLQNTQKEYFVVAKKLSKSRENAAKKLSAEITRIMRTLALPHSVFHIQLETNDSSTVSTSGLEKILFQIKTNLDQPLQPLHKIVSGGELSRISLAIHMATAVQHSTPTLIFDEVDVGIGGGTAEIVGKLLRQLGETHQILCITHQPQVASQGHHHLYVQKSLENKTTQTKIHFLDTQEKIKEIARMLGGVEITKKTIEHAQEMLATANI